MATVTGRPTQARPRSFSEFSTALPLRFPVCSLHPYLPALVSPRRLRSFCCSAGSSDHHKSPPLLKSAISGLTELLRTFSPKKRRQSLHFVFARPSHCLLIDFTNYLPFLFFKLMGNSDNAGFDAAPLDSSVDDVLRILSIDYSRAYFLTGNFTSKIYANDCLFEDPTIKFTGKDQYSQNLNLLVPFFDRPSLVLQKIEKGCNNGTNFIIAKWKLRTYLKFPWRPFISIVGTTTYELNEEFQIVKHVESWNISPLEAIGQIFAPGSRVVEE